MAERMQRINFALNTIPHYDGNINTLNMFINSVSLVLDLLGTIQPALDVFEGSTVFLSIRSKITGKALESIKDSNIRGWDEMRNFADKSNSVTILNEILNVTTIKNPTILFDIIKGKFNAFKAKIYVEENNEVKRNAVIEFVEKLIITHYITNLNDPFRNNLATRNPRSLNEIETLIKNDLQYLKVNQTPRPINNNFNTNNRFNRNKPQAYQSKFPTNKTSYNNRQFNFETPTRNEGLPKPKPMSVQTRQTRPQFAHRETYYNEEFAEGNSKTINELPIRNESNIEVNENEVQNHFFELGPKHIRKKS